MSFHTGRDGINDYCRWCSAPAGKPCRSAGTHAPSEYDPLVGPASSPQERPPKTESQKRKEHPMFQGLLKYFPRALMAVAGHSYTNNEKHNPGEPVHWSREKSADHDDCIIRHSTDMARGEVFDNEGQRHSVARAWRALAAAELELEAEAKQFAAELSEAYNQVGNREQFCGGCVYGGSVFHIRNCKRTT